MAKRIAAVRACMFLAGIGVLALGSVASTARAQCDHSLTTYASSDLDGGGVVTALTTFDDGTGPALIAAGLFLWEDPAGSDYYDIAKWTPDGWVPLAEPDQLGTVNDFEVFGNHLYAADSQVMRWEGNNNWSVAGAGLVGGAGEMVVFDDGSGSGPSLFVTAGSYQNTGRLLKLSNGVWHEIATFNSGIWAVEASGGNLIVTGLFTAVNDVPVNRVAAWDGRTWSDWGGGVGVITDLIEYQINGAPALVGCGTFTIEDQGGLTTDVAYWDGSGWSGLPAINLPNEDNIGPMIVWDNGDGQGPALYVAVTTEAPSSLDDYTHLLRLNPSTQQWQALYSTYYMPDSYIYSMTTFEEGNSRFATLFVGGKFYQIGGVESYHLARILPQPEGGDIEPLPSNPRSLRGEIKSLTMFDDGGGGPALYAGGSFRGLHHNSYTLVAHYSGESWTNIGHGGGHVEVVKVLDDGSGPALYAGGSFSIHPNNGQIASNIAKWDGLNWIGMGSPGGTVYAMCVHDDGSGPAIYIVAQNTVKKWNATAGTWSSMGPTLSNGGMWGPDLNTLVSFDDGSGPALYIAGDFDTVNGMPASNIARWRGPGQGWSAVGEGLPGYVTMLHVHDDASGPRLIANGAGSNGRGVAQWDGEAWSVVGNLISIEMGAPITALTTFDDGSGPALIASTPSRMARWNGAAWALLAYRGADAFAANGDVLYMGDPFSIWAPGGSPLSITEQVGGGSFEPGHYPTTLEVSVAHGGAVTHQWRRDGVPLMNVSGYHGAYTRRLQISNLNGSHEGVYDVVVSNDCTTIVSDAMEIEVIGTCAGDITTDGLVDVDDLIAVLLAWGACPLYEPCAADLTHDGAVNADDLIMVILRWGECTE